MPASGSVVNIAGDGTREFDGVRVLVIDDSTTIRRAATSILERVGCSVVSASDGFAALADIVEVQPDIIFVDSRMPRLDGYQTCAVIKQNVAFQHVPVIIMSNLDHHLDRVRGRMLGIDGYLTKPFGADELVYAVRRHLDG
jgi:twitching motility two-component system response regulator PilG